MMGQLLGNLLNIVLGPVMILAFHWNSAGAAIATVIGNVADLLSTAKAIVTRHRGHISNRYVNEIITFTATIPQAG